MIRSLISFIFVCFFAMGQSNQPVPLANVYIPGITTTTVLDNRSSITRQLRYSSIACTGSGSWSVTLQYGSSPSGSWSSVPGSPTINQANSPPIAFGFLFASPSYYRVLISSGTPTCAFSGFKDLFVSVVSGSGNISSVFGRTGVVVPVSGDYTAAQVTNAADTTSTYSNPAWISALAASKLTGIVSSSNGGAGSISGMLKADGSGNVSSGIAGVDYVIPSGNVATATALLNTRLINGVSFNGTSNITITANLPALPTGCSSGQYATAIAVTGNLTCAAVSYGQVTGTPSLAAIATSGSASDLSTGTVPTARLGSGTANSTTCLYGDQTYKTCSGGGGGGAVSSVFGRTGAVVQVSGDYNASQITNAVDTTFSYSNPSWITAIATSKLAGVVATPNLGSGTANSTTCLYGDQTYKTCGTGVWSVGTGLQLVSNEFSINSAVTQTRSNDQAGTNTYARSTTGNDTYVVSLTPTLTAYTRGGCLTLDADTGNTLAATINVDTLGAKSILTRTGGALASGDITANKPIQICYDGTQYIIQGDGGGASVSTVSQFWCPMGNCASERGTRFTLGSANRTYFWRFYVDRNRFVRRIGFPGFPIADTHVYGIYDSDGTTLLASCNSASTGINPSGGMQWCDIGSQYTLVSGGEYMLVLATSGTTSAVDCAGTGTAYEISQVFASAPSYFPNSRALWGYGSNVASGSTTSMVLPATMGTFTSANQCLPQVAFLPN